MIVGLYHSARRRWPDLPAFALRSRWRMRVFAEGESVFLLWLTKRTLLAVN